MRTLEDIDADLDIIHRELQEMYKQQTALKAERDAALTARADHPWIGKSVKYDHVNRYGYGASRGKTVTLRGKVTVLTADMRGRLTGSWRYSVGDIVVVTHGGKKIHGALGHGRWQLDEKEG